MAKKPKLINWRRVGLGSGPANTLNGRYLVHRAVPSLRWVIRDHETGGLLTTDQVGGIYQTGGLLTTDQVGGIYRGGMPAAFVSMKDAKAAVEAMVIKDDHHADSSSPTGPPVSLQWYVDDDGLVISLRPNGDLLVQAGPVRIYLGDDVVLDETVVDDGYEDLTAEVAAWRALAVEATSIDPVMQDIGMIRCAFCSAVAPPDYVPTHKDGCLVLRVRQLGDET